MLWLIVDADPDPDKLDIEECAAEEQCILVEADTFEQAVDKMHKTLGEESFAKAEVGTYEDWLADLRKISCYLIPLDKGQIIS